MQLLNTTDMSLEFCRNLGAGCFEGFIQLHRSLTMSLILMQVQCLISCFGTMIVLPSGANVVRNSFHKVDFLWNLQVFNEKQSHLCFFGARTEIQVPGIFVFLSRTIRGVCRMLCSEWWSPGRSPHLVALRRRCSWMENTKVTGG